MYQSKLALVFLLMSLSYAVIALADSDEQKPRYHLAIDFGSTNIVSTLNAYMPEYCIYPHQVNYLSMPSVVAFTNNGTLVGESAKSQYALNPTNTIVNVGQFLGRRFSDPIIQDAIRHSLLNIKETSDGRFAIQVEVNNMEELFTPEEIVAVLFREIKDLSKEFYSLNNNHHLSAVVTVPRSVAFDNNIRQAIKDAGTIAGLDIERISNIFSASIFAYKTDENNGIYIVYHQGGNTLQLALIVYEDNVIDTLEEINVQLGGTDFDQRVVDYITKKYRKSHEGKDISKSHLVLDKLKRQIEKAKISLSNSTLTHIEIQDPFFGDINNNTFNEVLTREIFEQLNKDLFNRSIKHIDYLLLKANITKQQVDGVILSGGSIHIPKISSLLGEYFKDNHIYNTHDPINVAAYGTANIGRSVMSGGEGIACFWSDTLGVSYGVESVGGVMVKILPRDNPIPIKQSLIFSTATDNQTSAKVRIFRGEQILTKNNVFVTEFDWANILPTPHGISLIEITFELDEYYKFSVTVKDLHSGHSSSFLLDKPYLELNDSADFSSYFGDDLIKEKIDNQCAMVDNPDLQDILKDQKILDLPNCRIMQLEPVEEDSPHVSESRQVPHDEL